MNLIGKVLFNIKTYGFSKTLIKIIKYPTNKIKEIIIKKTFKKKSIEERFLYILKTNKWGDKESLSGTGSNLKSTKNLIEKLPLLINKFKIYTLFDAPCGDFNWMKHLLKKVNVEYLGSDIVEEIINLNIQKYKSDKINFKKINIINDKLPNADLMICRDCLFHFSYDDIFSFLKNFVNSKIKFLLVTSNLNDQNKFLNKDIITGDFTTIDLFSEPFNFKKNYLFKIEDRDYTDTSLKYKYLYMFSRDQVKSFLK